MYVNQGNMQFGKHGHPVPGAARVKGLAQRRNGDIILPAMAFELAHVIAKMLALVTVETSTTVMSLEYVMYFKENDTNIPCCVKSYQAA